MKQWVKYQDDFYLVKWQGENEKREPLLLLAGENRYGNPIEILKLAVDVVPVTLGLIKTILAFFKSTPEQKKARRDWRQYKKEQRHQRRIERIEARNKNVK